MTQLTDEELASPAVATEARARGPLAWIGYPLLLVGLVVLIAGQVAFDERLQPMWEHAPPWGFQLPMAPRLAPGFIGVIVGGLLVSLGAIWLAPSPFADLAVPPRSRIPHPLVGRALIGAALLVAAALSVHILLLPNGGADDAARHLNMMVLRPVGFVVAIVLGGIGCALLGRTRPGAPLPLDRWDLLWIAGSMGVFVAATVPTLEDWRYSFIGDEYAFYQVAFDLASARPWDMFWQAGVYSTHPLMSSFIPALTMRLFGDDIAGWKLGLVAMGIAAIPPTYLLARWQFDRTTAQVAAAVLASSHYLYAYSHTGHNNIDSVLPVALTLCLATAALVRPSPLLWYAAGATTGFSLFFFFSARLAGPILALVMLSRGWSRFRDGFGPALLGFIVVAAPYVARNQIELVTRMVVESVTTKGLPPDQALGQVLWLTLLSAIAFHTSDTHGLYISLGLLDPFSAALSAVGIVGAFLRFGDWRRRLLVICYVMIIFVAGGLARHGSISVPRYLVVLPIMAVLAGDAVSGIVRVLFGGNRGRWRQVAFATVALGLFGLLLGANLHRFRIVTPERNPSLDEMVMVRALYGAECRAAGPVPMLVGGARVGAIFWMMAGYEPNKYEPMVIYEPEYWQIPAYQRWPCTVAVDPSAPATVRMIREARNTGARVVPVPDLKNERQAVAIIRSPPAVAADVLPPAGRLLYSVALSNPRRGASFGAIDDGADLATGSDGHLFVVDRTNRSVTEFDEGVRAIAVWGGSGSLVSPEAADADERGLLVIDAGARSIVEFDRERRAVARRPWTELGLGLPRDIEIDSVGQVVITDESPGAIHLFDRDLHRLGRLYDVATDPDKARLLRPFQSRVAPDGTVVAYEPQGLGRVRRFATDGTVLETWTSPLRDGRLAVAPNGEIWIGGQHGRVVMRFSSRGERIAEFPAPAILGGWGEGGISGLAVTTDSVRVLWRHGVLGVYRVQA